MEQQISPYLVHQLDQTQAMARDEVAALVASYKEAVRTEGRVKADSALIRTLGPMPPVAMVGVIMALVHLAAHQ